MVIQVLREQLSLRVQAVYRHIPLLLAHDRDAFEAVSQEDLLSGPTTTIQSWLRMVEPTLQRCLKDATAKLSTNQTDIRDFFDEASYVDSDASDTSLSFDTDDLHTTSSGTLALSYSSSLSSSDLSSSRLSTEDSSSTGTAYSDSDTGPMSA